MPRGCRRRCRYGIDHDLIDVFDCHVDRFPCDYVNKYLGWRRHYLDARVHYGYAGVYNCCYSIADEISEITETHSLLLGW